jgi:hypothetical protein
VAAITIASLAAPAGMAAPTATAAAGGGLEVRVAQARDFSRIEFKGARAVARRDGQTLILKFSRDTNPDISRLRVSPPKWLKATEARRAGGGLELVLTLTDTADAKVGVADGVTYVNLFERPPVAAPVPTAVAAAANAAAAPAPAKPPAPKA